MLEGSLGGNKVRVRRKSCTTYTSTTKHMWKSLALNSDLRGEKAAAKKLSQRGTFLPKIYEPPQSWKLQKGDTKPHSILRYYKYYAPLYPWDEIWLGTKWLLLVTPPPLTPLPLPLLQILHHYHHYYYYYPHTTTTTTNSSSNNTCPCA